MSHSAVHQVKLDDCGQVPKTHDEQHLCAKVYQKSLIILYGFEENGEQRQAWRQFFDFFYVH